MHTATVNGVQFVNERRMKMAERSLVKCGADWMFCNQDCSDCTRCNFTVTNRTEGGSDNG